jgi:hypothetical protein
MGVDRSGIKSIRIVEHTTRVSDATALKPFPIANVHAPRSLVRTGKMVRRYE